MPNIRFNIIPFIPWSLHVNPETTERVPLETTNSVVCETRRYSPPPVLQLSSLQVKFWSKSNTMGLWWFLLVVMTTLGKTSGRNSHSGSLIGIQIVCDFVR
jgi:hypothetical protein